MDSRTLKLTNHIDDYLRHPPPGAPEQLITEIENMREMLSAPRFTGESPGEREAREVTEATMPPDVAAEYYPDETQGGDEASTQNVGVFSAQ